MMVFHPSWGYFARSYGLRQIPIEIEGKEPRPRELAHLIHTARESKVRAIFIQPQFARRAALALADQIGAKVIEADPMALSWEENLLQLAQTICKAKQ